MPSLASALADWLNGQPLLERTLFLAGLLGGVGVAIAVRRLLRQRWRTAVLAGILAFAATLALAPVQTQAVLIDMPSR